MIEEKTIKLFKTILKDKGIHWHLKDLKEHHKETYEHCLRVGLLCIYLGFENNLSKNQIKILGYAGFLHDIGKIQIPLKILSKKGKLTEKEMEKIKEHPRRGFLMLKKKKFNKVRKIIIAHHEFSIYPYPRAGMDRRKINRKEKRRSKEKTNQKLSQILSVADHYDALHNKRAYKEPLQCKQIKVIMEKEFKGKKKYVNQVIEKCLIENPLEI